jgi:hypothetical protein
MKEAAHAHRVLAAVWVPDPVRGTLFRGAVVRVPVPFDPHERCHST